MANALGQQGYRVVRVYMNDKRPVGLDWPKNATSDTDVLTRQFTAGDFNIGVACGPQPNGLNLVVIDVDTREGGLATWARLCAEHEPFDTVEHVTPSGGLHAVFDAGDHDVRNGRLAPGIDVRGDGGQIVVPPSRRNGQRYDQARPGSGLHRRLPAPLPGWLAEMLTARPAAPVIKHPESAARHPSSQAGVVTNADWLADHWSWLDVLMAQGYSVVKQVGETVYVRHPTATAEWSALVHLDSNHMNAFSTNMPGHLRDAQVNRDGSIAWSPYDWFVATSHGGDYSEATREINRRRAPLVGDRGRAAPAPSVEGTALDRLPTLPDEFWEHPFNAHILAAARARRCGPDALALNTLLRASILVPPSYLLPPLAGGFSPINLLGCVVGRTGEGKSVSIAAAADVLHSEHPWLLWDMPLGSGEGVGDVFMVDELEDDPKSGRKRKTGRRVQNKDLRAVHFTVDEGAALVEQSTRRGATIIPALCKAWTGVTLGETNADVTTRRRVKALSYRISAVINIQPANFHRLFNTANTGTGLTGRFLFAPAADYDMPDQRGEWPGTLDFPTLHGSTFGDVLTYDPAIEAEVDAAIVRANRTGGTPENVSHSNLLRARVAAIYALAEDRRTISEADWHVAGLFVATSTEVLTRLDSQAAQRRSDERHSTALAKAEVEIVIEDVKERQGVARMAEAIRRAVKDGPLTQRKVARKVSASSTRHRFEPALVLAVANGWVKVIDEQIEAV